MVKLMRPNVVIISINENRLNSPIKKNDFRFGLTSKTQVHIL